MPREQGVGQPHPRRRGTGHGARSTGHGARGMWPGAWGPGSTPSFLRLAKLRPSILHRLFRQHAHHAHHAHHAQRAHHAHHAHHAQQHAQLMTSVPPHRPQFRRISCVRRSASSRRGCVTQYHTYRYSCRSTTVTLAVSSNVTLAVTLAVTPVVTPTCRRGFGILSGSRPAPSTPPLRSHLSSSSSRRRVD